VNQANANIRAGDPVFDNYRLFLPTEEHLNDNDLILGILKQYSKTHFKLLFLHPLKIIFITVSNTVEPYSVELNSYLPINQLLPRILRKIGERIQNFVCLQTLVDGQYKELPLNRSLYDLSIPDNANLSVVIVKNPPPSLSLTENITTQNGKPITTDGNIWDEPNIPENFQFCEGVSISGTLNKLCERLAYDFNHDHSAGC
jgi:hypothetical protein